jgi:U32 family peptidase
MSVSIPELLVPAGNLSKLKMALRYGADAVYVGASGLSMRPDQVAFGIAELAEGVRLVHEAGKKIYVAINNLMFDDDIEALQVWLNESAAIPIDAVIVSDLGAIALVKEIRPDVEIHISTQMSVANARAARFVKELGASRVVLARECSLSEAANIAKAGEIEVELFVHGAMCMAVSGRCLISSHLCGSSASKGQCKQSCRWEWQLVEAKRPGEGIPIFEAGNQTIFLGSKDLCMIDHIPELVSSGTQSLKIEGRMKSEYYVATVARVYRQALDAYATDPMNYCVDPRWLKELDAVSHRPYSTGFAFGYPEHDPNSIQTHNSPISTCVLAGYVRAEKEGCHRIEVKNPFRPGDKLEWIGPELSGGDITIEKILGPHGESLDATISATEVEVFFEESDRLPVDGILRRRK